MIFIQFIKYLYMKDSAIQLFVLLCIFFAFACEKKNDEDPPDESEITEIEIISPTKNVKEFLTLNLEAKAYSEDGEELTCDKIAWSSENDSIAIVDNSGCVTGLKAGKVVISASCGSLKDTLTLTILQNAILNFTVEGLPDTLIVSHKTNPVINLQVASGDYIENFQHTNFSLLNDSTANFTGDNQIIGIDKGTNSLIIEIGDTSLFHPFFVSIVEIEDIDPFLSTPGENSIYEMPVVIIRFLPTTDGENLDVVKATGFGQLDSISLSELKNNIDVYNIRGKFMLEEGSRFRGYKNDEAPPSLGYRIMKYITVYDQIPAGDYVIGEDGGVDIYAPDYKYVFDQYNLNNYINNHNIKEVWLWYGEPARPSWSSYDPALHGSIEKHVSFVESNMSSPASGDISNSHRYQDDIYILDHSFVVYCYNFRRTQAEMIHNHGHQLECIYKYAAVNQDGNYNLFVSDFSGWGEDYSSPPIGRAGDCHHPPNTTEDYDYLNTTLVESDIEDWTPDYSGELKKVNSDTWGGIDYSWPSSVASNIPQKTESQWYIYWMQNMPGYQNGISYAAGKNMTNWWYFTANWDDAVSSGMGLHE
jgi:hypothetical protein